jgi:hypothetical protein
VGDTIPFITPEALAGRFPGGVAHDRSVCTLVGTRPIR